MRNLSTILALAFLALVSCNSPQTDKAKKTEISKPAEETVLAEKQTSEKEDSSLGIDSVPGFANSNTAKFLAKENVNVFTYEKWIVEISRGEVGDNISVKSRTDNQEIFTETNMYFGGISGKYLLGLHQTSVIGTFWIYDLEQKKQLHDFSVEKEKIQIKDGQIVIWQILDKAPETKPDCPEAKKWVEEYGLGVGYKEKVLFNLTDGKITHTGEFTCFAMS